MPRLPKITTAKIVACAAVFAVLCIAAFYYFVDPASGLMPRCAFRTLTGYECPGCGVQRALHALLHGHLAEAWHYNAYVFFALPAAIFYIVVEQGRHRWPRLHYATVRPAAVIVIGLSIIAWWVGRNLCG